MKKSSKWIVFGLVLALACTGVFAKGTTESETKKKNIVFYGRIVEFTSGDLMVEKTQEILADKYTIEPIQVDWANLSKVIKTGIASGEPADIYAMQGQYMGPFVEAGQALDLTPYLEANDGEWMKQYSGAALEVGAYDGKIYNVPLNTNLSAIFINKTILNKAGVEVPDAWTWVEFMDACDKIQQNTGAYPFGICAPLNDFMFRNGLLSLGKDAGVLEKLHKGQIEATSDIFRTAIRNTKELYDMEYWYPGKGALTQTRDEVTAAFMQGKVAMIGEVTAVTSNLASNANFEVGVIRWPSMGSESVVLGGTDGFFIPSNVSDPDAAADVLKTFLSEEVQAIHAAKGYATANINVSVDNATLQQAIALSSDVYPNEFLSLTTKIEDYVKTVLTVDYCLGEDENVVLNELEELRQKGL